ncbi:hypothetical protein JMN32_12045 [Fulvivirga sp. 29W222]|uniref:Uncharacterized protein n=1 Tax=Fulvivirga marina TaxID=2494733 RepID=A0A937FVZ4_9BACT|nr:hypothetical protein [Fulvivirga marina]MBL6447044.1 hypothetical protein [Fulvivirga marina]
MITITEKEQLLMSEIISKGYRNAAVSFSKLTGQQVMIEVAHVELCSDHNYLLKKYNHQDNLTILQTEIIGQLSGVSYLIFNEKEKITISQMSLASFGSNSTLDENIILLEIDNIISAAVITELSNMLNLRIYGDVPALLKFDNMTDFHNSLKLEDEGHYVLTNSTFLFANHKMISPIFLWKMDKRILEIVNDLDN